MSHPSTTTTPPLPPPSSRVLSIQSHVVHGYVGNKSAVFPLQLLGFEVDVVNSVQFSNHTGYENGFRGTVLDGDELRALTKGLDDNSLLEETSHLLTGYIGSASFLSAIVEVVAKLKSINPSVRYVCDPVLGDNGKLYVPPELVDLYRTKIVPLSYMVTPNSFECEQLTGVAVTSMSTATAAADLLHDMGPEIVVITSMSLGGVSSSTITVLASCKGGEKWAVDCQKLEGTYTGTGDLCAALLLGWDALTPSSVSSDVPRLKVILGKVVNTMFEVIGRTHGAAGGYWATARRKELKIVQSKREIEQAGASFRRVLFVPYEVK